MTESGFDPGLQDPARSGVFFVTSEDLPFLAAAAHDAGLLPRQMPSAARSSGSGAASASSSTRT